MNLKMVSLDNQEVGSVELSEDVFGLPIRRDILAQKDLPTSERHQLLGALRFPMEAWGDAGSGAEPSQRGNR